MIEQLQYLALAALYLLASLGVVAAVVCRVNEMSSKRHKLSWFIMYCAYAVYSLAVAGEVLSAQEVDPVHLLGLLALGLNLLITMKNWGPGKTPGLSCKPGCGP